MQSLVVIGQQIMEKRRGAKVPPPAYLVSKDPSLNRVKQDEHHEDLFQCSLVFLMITYEVLQVVSAIKEKFRLKMEIFLVLSRLQFGLGSSLSLTVKTILSVN